MNGYERSGQERTRKSRRRPDRQKSGAAERNWDFFRAARWLCGIILSSTLLFGLILGLLYAYRYATTSDHFAIRSITVTGATHFDRDSVLRAAGLSEGMNSLAVNITDVELALRKTPWVANVAVKRQLPDSFAIEIEERLPAFWVLKGDALLYADSKGNLIAPVGPENFLSLPALELDQGGDVLLDKLEHFVMALHNTSMPLEIGAASWLKLSAARGFELFLEKYGLSISIGAEAWEENLQHLGMVLHDLARRGEIKSVREVWATDGHVWVHYNKKK
ncbi:MAG: FtsQ-type POTRA domain-containing protein [Deltaproteobacteria bacterium]|jgi:cell division protein FtsQ|nr:FtsQ-type POTRA domain-containing protein [Deltaproteobacteria bacterium]